MKRYVSLFLILILISFLLPFATAATSSSTSAHFYFNGKLIETITNGVKSYYHHDYLGSTRIITDTGGNLVASINYAPFGRELIGTTKAKYTFTGKEEDSTKLQYFGARYYDPERGRFTQVDPKYNPAESPYAYVENNPMIKTDPTGMYSWKEFKADWNYAWETGPIMNTWNSLVNINNYMVEHQDDVDVIANNLAMVPVIGAVGKGIEGAIAAEKTTAAALKAERVVRLAAMSAEELQIAYDEAKNVRGLAKTLGVPIDAMYNRLFELGTKMRSGGGSAKSLPAEIKLSAREELEARTFLLPDEILTRTSLIKTLKRANLNPREEQAVLEHFSFGTSYSELARMFGVSNSRVEQLVSSGLKKLRATYKTE